MGGPLFPTLHSMLVARARCWPTPWPCRRRDEDLAIARLRRAISCSDNHFVSISRSPIPFSYVPIDNHRQSYTCS
jgi:hypothetical protein